MHYLLEGVWVQVQFILRKSIKLLRQKATFRFSVYNIHVIDYVLVKKELVFFYNRQWFYRVFMLHPSCNSSFLSGYLLRRGCLITYSFNRNSSGENQARHKIK